MRKLLRRANPRRVRAEAVGAASMHADAHRDRRRKATTASSDDTLRDDGKPAAGNDDRTAGHKKTAAFAAVCVCRRAEVKDQ